ncbi:hypothetical protein C4D60_Mb04t38610 [Musa balbisiana]|uniref:TLC domain-containing protein n=1 Tax=Musa balbisiana TaxID=52838 RepID=A0A4S8KHX9_MUSBA|nr:hypothetical protein C4D60_Mb04t38610 [Musa balbisiana]
MRIYVIMQVSKTQVMAEKSYIYQAGWLVLHHLLSATSISYTMLSGEGQLYTYMVLISETTTPGINLRWLIKE